MKKLLLIIITLFIVSQTYAQSFELTSEGLKNTQDKSKEYVVIEFPNMTKEQIFEKSRMYLTSIYVSANDVMSTSGTDLIAINGATEVPYHDGLHNCKANIKYRVNMSFKDNKAKFECVIYDMKMYFNSKTYPLEFVKGGLYNGLYKKNGELTTGGEKAQSPIEDIPNHLIDGLKKSTTNTTDDNW